MTDKLTAYEIAYMRGWAVNHAIYAYGKNKMPVERLLGDAARIANFMTGQSDAVILKIIKPETEVKNG